MNNSHTVKEHEQGAYVEITIDNKKINIHRGHQTVSAIKIAGGVQLAFELAQIVEGKLTPLPDDSFVIIKGGEIFVSYPKTGAAS